MIAETDVLAALERFEELHQKREMAHGELELCKADYEERYTGIMDDVRAELDPTNPKKKLFSNDELRERETLRRLKLEHPNILRDLARLETSYNNLAKALERADRRVNTLRGLLDFRTSENNMVAAKVHGERVLVELQIARLRASWEATSDPAGRFSDDGPDPDIIFAQP